MLQLPSHLQEMHLHCQGKRESVCMLSLGPGKHPQCLDADRSPLPGQHHDSFPNLCFPEAIKKGVWPTQASSSPLHLVPNLIMPGEGNKDTGVSVPQHHLVLFLQGQPPCSHYGEPSPCVKRERGGQTDTWAPLPVSVEREPRCPQHRELAELPWPQDPSCRQQAGRGWLPNATTGSGDILPLSQVGFRQVSVQHLRISPGEKQQRYWRGALHMSGEEESGTSLTTESQPPHTQANGSETKQ